ncbi:transcription initiation protein [Nocardioides sp. Root122]|uniref:YciI family protein n=1 Tax=Nocardioides TaxID=1839 RepID=UPI000702B14D|nr:MULTISPECIES: YciI family protein [Nocardioides]KQV69744.1 transcription initiation protein [Nocardioides sp. Root122]MCK9823054.1 YciI family protein [Nocardioides cavernae]
MAEYTVLIIGDADRWWTSMTLTEREEGYAQYARFNEALAAGGHTIVGGAELTRTSEARSIPAGGGPATEGPYAEAVEAVGGYYQIRTDDLDGLVECCQIIAATGDGIEVRPNVDAAERPS